MNCFTDPNETGGAREIIPQAGDTFAILVKWLDLDAQGQVTQPDSQEGKVLIFGSQPFGYNINLRRELLAFKDISMRDCQR